MPSELIITTDDGETLEAESAGPGDAHTAVVMCHPHPAYGGDMRVPVLNELMAGLSSAGHGVLRFNFRSAGRSTGTHDGGGAERLDVEAAVATARAQWAGADLVLLGYSFGADVSLAAPVDPSKRVLIAPPLRFGDVAPPACPTLLLVPEHDQFSPPDRARKVTAGWPDVTVEVLAGADHFLSGAIGPITRRTVDWLA